jgi:hypothetical protein
LPRVCRRLLWLPLIFAVALLCGCPPPALRIPLGYQRHPWMAMHVERIAGDPNSAASLDHIYCDYPGQGPFSVFYKSLQPEAAVASPTGTQVAMVTSARDGSSPEGGLWIYAPLARGFDRLVDAGVKAQSWDEVSPWSPDGRALVYVQSGNLVYRPLAGQPKQLTYTGDVFTAAISPDGRQVAYGRRDANGADEGLWSVPAAGGQPKPLAPPTKDIFHACNPHWSPDGKWIAFLQAYEGGALGVVSADGSDLRTGLEAAWEPVKWLPDSQTVLFAKIMAGEPGDGVQSYNVAMKQVTPLAARGRNATYALSPDATRLLVASWHESSIGKVSDCQMQLFNLTSQTPEGDARKLDGFVPACAWAPDGKQMALLLDGGRGKTAVWYSADGIARLGPLGEASAFAGWARQWQPPWWRFGR